MHWRPRKPNLKVQPCRQIRPLGPETTPSPRLLPTPRPRKGDACRAEEGNQVYFVRRAFCASNTWREWSIKFPNVSESSHTPSTMFSPTWIPDRSTWKKKFWTWTWNSNKNIKRYLKAEIASFMSSSWSSRLSMYLFPTFHQGILSITCQIIYAQIFAQIPGSNWFTSQASI